MIITIDGPAGAGKTTVAKMLARKLGFEYLETGLIFRVIAYIGEKFDERRLQLKEGRAFYNGEDITSLLKTEEVGREASKLAVDRRVRELATRIQRAIVSGRNFIVEGRDAGSYVFPKAEFKFFLSASFEERARRRYKELVETGQKVSFEEILKSVKERDEQDGRRAFAPLVVPENALIIDTDGIQPEDVVERILVCIISNALRALMLCSVL